MNPFQQSQKDTIIIIDAQGNHSHEVKSHVTPGLITTYDLSVDIVEGNIIERVLPNNRIETYLVLESNYRDGFHMIPAHYQLKVRKTTAIEFEQRNNITYNLHGNNSRVYNHSTDNSTNSVGVNSESLFETLREVINRNVENNENLLLLLSEMESSKDSPSYVAKYSSFIANAANHMTLIAPYIPALTAYLTGHKI